MSGNISKVESSVLEKDVPCHVVHVAASKHQLHNHRTTTHTKRTSFLRSLLSAPDQLYKYASVAVQRGSNTFLFPFFYCYIHVVRYRYMISQLYLRQTETPPPPPPTPPLSFHSRQPVKGNLGLSFSQEKATDNASVPSRPYIESIVQASGLLIDNLLHSETLAQADRLISLLAPSNEPIDHFALALDIYFSLISIVGGRHGAQQPAEPASLIADASAEVAAIDVASDKDAFSNNLVGISPRTVFRSHIESQALSCCRCLHILRCRLRCQGEAMYRRYGTEECHHEGGYRHCHKKAGCGITHDKCREILRT
mmetsp:Transcript_31937/g.93887  ORF Transcript_31937/g.93887 Transcript_31937/m.93887 type:complete len:311 (+) Transcript_31937:149-1081(+)